MNEKDTNDKLLDLLKHMADNEAYFEKETAQYLIN